MLPVYAIAVRTGCARPLLVDWLKPDVPCLRWLAPRAGFEPATIRLTVECSTAELPRNSEPRVRQAAAYNKAFPACKGRNADRWGGMVNGPEIHIPQCFIVFLRGRCDAPHAIPVERSHAQPPPNRRIPVRPLATPDLDRGDSMPVMPADRARVAPSIVPSQMPALSDDECLLRLAQAIEEHDSERLDEVARLIGRLAVAIE
jgi:hypothetical protein